MVLIADLHTHTCVSHDSMTPIDILLKTAVRRGINVLAVTDHDTAKGGLTALRIAKLRGLRLMVIPGAEFKTEFGDIVALFVDRDIKGPLSLEELRNAADKYGWILSLPHPSRGRKGEEAWEAAEFVDLVEVVNASNSRGWDRLGLKISKKLNLPGIGVSDAHFSDCLGRGYTVIRGGDPKEALLKGDVKPVFVEQCSLYKHLLSLLIGIAKRVSNRGYC